MGRVTQTGCHPRYRYLAQLLLALTVILSLHHSCLADGPTLGALPDGYLFDAPIADPRWPHFAAAYHRYLNERDFHDEAAVSFGETFIFYRWKTYGDSYIELGAQAAVFSIFDLFAPSAELVNTDFFVSLPAVGFRTSDDSLEVLGRVFHQSSHLGDEFLLRNSRLTRVNLSYESADLKLSYRLAPGARLYGGAGYLFDQDPSNLKPWSVQLGVQYAPSAQDPQTPPDSVHRFWTSQSGRFYVSPVAGLDVQGREENHWNVDISLRLGVELARVLGRRVMILGEYFNGNSHDGQFYKHRIDYIGAGLHFFY